MHKNFVSLREVFNTHPSLLGVRNIIRRAEVVEKFNKIFPELKEIVIPVGVKKDVLLLKTENPVLRNELKLNEELVIKKTNEFFNEERIKSIRFVA